MLTEMVFDISTLKLYIKIAALIFIIIKYGYNKAALRYYCKYCFITSKCYIKIGDYYLPPKGSEQQSYDMI